MKIINLIKIFVVIVLLGHFANPATAAGEYPVRSVSLIVPYASGGGVDTVGRIVAKGLSDELGQSVVVDNKPGAGSNVGSDYVAKSAPDGYTLLLASPATAVNVSLYKHMPFDTAKDLRPVTLIGKVPSVMIVSNNVQASTLKEFVALAKKAPGTLNFGSGGSGASEHLAGEMFKPMAGVDIVHVPYRGGAAAMSDLIAGRISVVIINEITALPLIQSGKVRALALADGKRSPLLPEVPTFAEQGYPNYEVSVWWGVMGPSGMADAVVAKLNESLQVVLAKPDIKESLQKMGVDVMGQGPIPFGAFLESETKRWAEIVMRSVERID